MASCVRVFKCGCGIGWIVRAGFEKLSGLISYTDVARTFGHREPTILFTGKKVLLMVKILCSMSRSSTNSWNRRWTIHFLPRSEQLMSNSYTW
jgi:hypothetical protein